MGKGSGQTLADRLLAQATDSKGPSPHAEEGTVSAGRERTGAATETPAGASGMAEERASAAATGAGAECHLPHGFCRSRWRRLTRSAAIAITMAAAAVPSAPAAAPPAGGEPGASRLPAKQLVQRETPQPDESPEAPAPPAQEPAGLADPEAQSPDAEGADDQSLDAGAVDAGGRWEQQWDADEAALAERWPELEQSAEDAIKQRFREIREQVGQARQALAALAREMEDRHRQQHEEMQARHAGDRAAADGAIAVTQIDQRHQQERAALQRDQDAERAGLAEAEQELERHLEGARRDVAQARADAGGGAGPVGGTSPAGEISPAGETGGLPADDQATGERAGPAAGEAVVPAPGSEPPASEIAPQQTEAATTDDPAATPPEGDVVAEERNIPPPPSKAASEADNEAVSEPASEGTGEAAGRESPARPSSAGEPSPVRDVPAEGIAVEPGGASDSGRPDVAQTGAVETDAARTAAPPPGGGGPPPSPEEIAGLIDRGDALLDLGDLAGARLFYRRAAGRGSAEGAMRMGMTFDPVYFARTGVLGTRPRIEDALEWYRKAIAMGSQPAEARMTTLRSWLERAAAAGDPQAEAALQQLR